MGRFSARVGVGLLLGATGSAGASGCAENDSTLFILGVAAIGSDCTYTPSGSTTMMPSGQLDVGFDQSYQAGLVLANQMASRGDKSRSRTETSRIILEGAEVNLLLPDGSSLRDAFSAPGAGFVDVGSGAEPGYGILSVVLIPRPNEDQVAKALDQGYVIAEVKAFGKTLGGQEVESNVFRFPIDVCRGCLVTFPSSAVMVNTEGEVECRLSGDEETTAAPCFWGQDQQVVCTACAASHAVCAAPPKP